MNYQVLNECGDYSPNGRQIDILFDGKNTAYALHIIQGELCERNDIIPSINQPRAEVVFSEYLEPLLIMDAGSYGDDCEYNYSLYSEHEYNRMLNGYTPEPLIM